MPDNPLPDLDLGLTNNRFVKWLATTGAWRLGKNDDELIFDRMSFQLDAGAAEIGLFSYGEGGPEYIPGVNSTPPKTGEWKPGCRLALHSADVPNGLGEPLGLMTWTTTQAVVLPRLQKLFRQYRAAPEAKDGLLPVVAADEAAEVKLRGKTFYAPTLVIASWEPRRPELANGAAE